MDPLTDCKDPGGLLQEDDDDEDHDDDDAGDRVTHNRGRHDTQQ